MNTESLDEQISNYLSLLSPPEKKAVLMVVKTIARAKQEYDDIWEDKEFVKEMDKRVSEYENGTAKLYKYEEMKKNAKASYKAKSGNKK